MEPVFLILTALQLTCKEPEVGYGPSGVVNIVTMAAPIAVASGGTPPYKISPDVNVAFIVTGVPTKTEVQEYTVTDDAGNTDGCTAFVNLLESESILKIPRRPSMV